MIDWIDWLIDIIACSSWSLRTVACWSLWSFEMCLMLQTRTYVFQTSRTFQKMTKSSKCAWIGQIRNSRSFVWRNSILPRTTTQQHSNTLWKLFYFYTNNVNPNSNCRTATPTATVLFYVQYVLSFQTQHNTKYNFLSEIKPIKHTTTYQRPSRREPRTSWVPPNKKYWTATTSAPSPYSSE